MSKSEKHSKYSCRYLGRPSYDLFYYRVRATGQILVATTDDEIAASTSGDVDLFPKYTAIDSDREIILSLKDGNPEAEQLEVRLPCSEEGHKEGYVAVPVEDILWMLNRGFVERGRVRFDDILRDFPQLVLPLLHAGHSDIFGEVE